MSEPDLTEHHSPVDVTEALRADVRAGLSALRKWLPPKWFYDAAGSELFEKITALPEYYPTRAEREILAGQAPAIARATGARTLVELGSGSSEKTRLLLDALTAHGTLETFVPLDVSGAALAEATEAIAAEYPKLAVRGVVGDFTEHLDLLPGGSRGWWPSSVAPSATSCPPNARSSCARCARCWSRGSGCCSGPTW